MYSLVHPVLSSISCIFFPFLYLLSKFNISLTCVQSGQDLGLKRARLSTRPGPPPEKFFIGLKMLDLGVSRLKSTRVDLRLPSRMHNGSGTIAPTVSQWWQTETSSAGYRETSGPDAYTTVRGQALKVIYGHLQGNPNQQRFTIGSGVLTGNDTRWHSASSGSPLPERTDFGPRRLQLWQTQPTALWPSPMADILKVWRQTRNSMLTYLKNNLPNLSQSHLIRWRYFWRASPQQQEDE